MNNIDILLGAQQMLESVDESVCASFDNDDQRAAYHMGVVNTLSALEALLNEDVYEYEDEDEFDEDEEFGEWQLESAENCPDLWSRQWECSVCGGKSIFNYVGCPHCGVIMKNGETV